MAYYEFVNEVWSRHLRDKAFTYGGSDMDAMKPLICQCCGGHIDRRTMMCPYCETQYNGKLEPVPVIADYEPDGYQTIQATVYVDELTFRNQEIAMKTVYEQLYEEMMKQMSQYVEVTEQVDCRRFRRIIRGRLKIFTGIGRNNL